MFRRSALLLLFAATASAQVVVEGAAPVGPGEVVAEARLATVRTAGATETAGPEGLVLWGIGRGLEVRFGLPPHAASELEPSGFGDPALGLKVGAGAIGGWTVSALAEVSLPVGPSARRGPASPLALVAAERTVGTTLVGAHVEAAWDRALDRVDVGLAATVSRPVAGPLGAFAEAVGATTPDGAAALAIVGAALTAGPVVVDAHLGLGLTAAAPDRVLGVGVIVGM